MLRNCSLLLGHHHRTLLSFWESTAELASPPGRVSPLHSLCLWESITGLFSPSGRALPLIPLSLRGLCTISRFSGSFVIGFTL